MEADTKTESLTRYYENRIHTGQLMILCDVYADVQLAVDELERLANAYNIATADKEYAFDVVSFTTNRQTMVFSAMVNYIYKEFSQVKAT